MEREVSSALQRNKESCQSMKQLTILSGKGGTGKTSITASFAVLAKNAVVADCDVDAPDLHMLLHPELIEMQQFKGSKVAVIDETKCIRCGFCREICVFDAITSDLKVDSIACEGCGACTTGCPANAVTLAERVSGSAYISKTKYGFMTHAMLHPGESNSGKLVTLVRQNAKILAEKENSDLIIIDGSPGIGCPVIASITGVDAGLVVTEPTLSGVHDLKRILRLLEHFSVTPLVCVNMYDINKGNADKITFNPKVTEAMVNGKTITEYSPESNVAKEIEKIWRRLLLVLKLGSG
jgi:MinD superfamily P-loop ATPase